MDSKSIRYQNTRLLVDAIGGVSNFADKIGKGQSQTSQFAGTNPIKGIGNKVAREIEEAFDKPYGWLDIQHHNIVTIPTFLSTSEKNDNQELQQLIESLIYLDSINQLPPEVITSFNSIVLVLKKYIKTTT